MSVIRSARHEYRAGTGAAMRAQHLAAITRRQARGDTLAVQNVSDPVTAYISENRWVIDCECGAGNFADPDHGIACCFGCGAVHTNVTFPTAETRDAIERTLLERPRRGSRNWITRFGEDLPFLVHENRRHGVHVPADVLALIGEDE
jgi:hypothetical protein